MDLTNKFETYFLSAVIFGYVLIVFLSENIIYTDEFIYRNLSAQVPVYYINGILESKERFWWVPYIIQVVVFLCKVLFASLCIFIGVLLSDAKLSFKDLFRTVIFAEIIFIASQGIYLFNLFIHKEELTFDTMANYFPLSMLSLYGVENVVTWLHYPLQTLNLFEFFYILLISWLLSKKWKSDFVESINIILPSYGVGLLLWMVLVVFLTLQMS